MIELLKLIINLNIPLINEKIKLMIAHTNIQIRQFKKVNNKGMLILLKFFGDPHLICS